MRFSTLTIIAGLAALSHAHFQLQYPGPRGPFVQDDEPNFCDGFDSSTSNRTTFPLDNGYFTFNSEHTTWSMAVYVAPVQNATSFQNFSTTLAKPFFGANGEGLFCISIDLGASGVSGVADGANVTLQFEFNGGDGKLYQCADLTLSKTATIPTSVTCSNATSASASATAPASTQHSGTESMLELQVSILPLLSIAAVVLSVL